MSGKTAFLENALLKLIFQAEAIANLADNAATSPATTLYLSLHTSDPTDSPATEQSENETTYTGYARKALTRSSGAWAVSANSVSPLANVDFNTVTAGSGTITHAGVGLAASGSGKLLYSGAITPAITIAVGVIPRLTTASAITEN
jgi:hypothetical protein